MQIKLNKFMHHWIVSLLIVILTIFALFGDNLRIAFSSKSADESFSVIMCFIFAVYTIEIFLNSISEDRYLFSFYFWLDIISTISLLLDMHWIMDGIWNYQEEDFDKMSQEQISALAKEKYGNEDGS